MENKLSLRKQNNPEYNPKFFENRVKAAKEKQVIAMKNYLLSPAKCKYCEEVFDYEKRHHKFCNRSCAANFNNALRTPEQHKERRNKIKEAYVKKFGEKYPFSPIYYTNCKRCDLVFIYYGKTKTYCTKCSFEDRKLYRVACKFNLNNKDHTMLFNGEMIKKYGWYAPANSSKPNIEGVTWDHLFRIEDGFVLGVKPEIMKHPANAELIPWRKNLARKTSLITYNELLQRIEWYEKGEFEKLTYFYQE